MTIILGFTLPDGVLLMADGRRSFPLADKPGTDDVRKIVRVSDTIFCMSAGVCIATDLATSILSKTVQGGDDPKAISQKIAESLSASWSHFKTVLHSSVDPAHPVMKAIIICGGVSNDEFFLASGLCDDHGVSEQHIIQTPWRTLTIGGERVGSEAIIGELIHPCTFLPWTEDGPINGKIQRMINAFAEGIRRISDLDQTIGGEISYTVVRKGFQVQRAVLA